MTARSKEFLLCSACLPDKCVSVPSGPVEIKRERFADDTDARLLNPCHSKTQRKETSVARRTPSICPDVRNGILGDVDDRDQHRVSLASHRITSNIVVAFRDSCAHPGVKIRDLVEESVGFGQNTGAIAIQRPTVGERSSRALNAHTVVAY